MTSSPGSFRLACAAALCVAVAAAAPALGESRAEEDVTPLALLRGADAVVLASPAPAGGGLVVEESIRGPLAAGVSVAPFDEGGTRPLDSPQARVVAVLRRTADDRWEVRGGALGTLAAADAPGGGPAAELFRALERALREEVLAARESGVRAALLAAVRDGGPRLRSGAALDLVADPLRLRDATDVERATLLEAFRACGPRERARAHLCVALARARVAGAGEELAAALAGPGGDELAVPVGTALRVLDDAAAVDVVARRAVTVDPGLRSRVVAALAASRHPAARVPLASLLGDGDAAIRREAAAGLGALRSAEAAPALLARFRRDGGAGTETDPSARRALAWALAQCDTADAWEALRAAAEGDPDVAFRAFIERTLANPRRAFVR